MKGKSSVLLVTMVENNLRCIISKRVSCIAIRVFCVSGLVCLCRRGEAQVIYVDTHGTSTNSPYALLSQAAAAAPQNTAIYIDPGYYSEAVTNVPITLAADVTVFAEPGVFYTITNYSSGQPAIQVTSGDTIVGGVWSNILLNSNFTDSMFGNYGTFPTNATFRDVEVHSGSAGFRWEDSNPDGGSVSYYDCISEFGYSGFVQTCASSVPATFHSTFWNCQAIGTNPPPSGVTLTDSRQGYKAKTSHSGTLELHNCSAEISDAGISIRASGIGNGASGTNNQFKVFGLTIDTTACTNPASADCGFGSGTNGLQLFSAVCRVDGNPLTWNNNDGTTNQPWRAVPPD